MSQHAMSLKLIARPAAVLLGTVFLVAPARAQEPIWLKDMKLGVYWHGAKVTLPDLRGKVVLIGYWGVSPGCRELMPHLVKLSYRLADRPIHIVTTVREDREKALMVEFFEKFGVDAKHPNFTVTNEGKHPKVKGRGYVPYYLVFDHHGRLRHHEMGGEYHSGDGLKMIEWVERLAKQVPDLYLGPTPFAKIPDLAERVAKKKKLAGAVKEMEARLTPPEGEPKPDAATKAELLRLQAVLANYRDRKLRSVELIYPSAPTRVLPMLTALRKEFRGTRLGVPVDAELRKQKSSARLKQAIKVHTDYARIVKKLRRIPACKYCRKEGDKHLRPGCHDCHTPQRKGQVRKEVQKLRRLHEAAEGLKIAKEIEKTILLYSSPIVEVNRRRR